MRHTWMIWMGAILIALCFGCQPQTELEPQPAEETEVNVVDDQAVTEMAGVTITVDGSAWAGSDTVSDAVTPVEVVITNSGDAPLSIEYALFTLAGAVRSYDALPVFEYRVVHGEPELLPGFEPALAPKFSVAEFFVAPYYATAYPDLEVYGESILLDRDYYGRHLGVWEESILPTPEMQRAALPEGVLQVGGKASGFLFFEGLADAEEKVNFLARLQDAVNDELIGTLRIPMEPELDVDLPLADE